MNDSSSSQGSNSSSSHSPLDDFDLCGDVVIMFSISVDDVKRSPYCELSGNSVNCNKTERTFQLRVNQYTSFNRPNPPHPPHSPSPLTFCARFDPARYKVKAPMPSDNSGVVVHGFVNDVERVPLGKHPTVFTFDVDQITFIGRTPVPAPVSSSVPLPSPSQGRFKFQYDTLLDSTSFPPSDISNNSFQSDNKTIEHRSQPSTPSHSTVEEHNLEEKRAGKRPRFD
ncbi:hypothetical protein BC826DRAFT_1074026 [Russula brevipes]|nr:hypothetical protein BC826DRAFT_1074026 [Russula brevipes]